MIEGPDGVQEYGPTELVQITQVGTEFWFVLRPLTDAEIKEAELTAQLEDANNAVAELSELVAALMG